MASCQECYSYRSLAGRQVCYSYRSLAGRQVCYCYRSQAGRQVCYSYRSLAGRQVCYRQLPQLGRKGGAGSPSSSRQYSQDRPGPAAAPTHWQSCIPSIQVKNTLSQDLSCGGSMEEMHVTETEKHIRAMVNGHIPAICSQTYQLSSPVYEYLRHFG